METEKEKLTQLNNSIGYAEARGDRKWLGENLAPELAFRRSDGKTVDDRTAFLEKVTIGGARETTIDSIDIHGGRAIVKCLVTVLSQPRREDISQHPSVRAP